MKLARLLVLISMAAFVVTGLAYLLVPGVTLSIVGIESAATTDFLIRTEGVALLTVAGLLFAVRDGSTSVMRVAMPVLAFYFIVGSLVDLVAFGQETVGNTSVPSAAARTGLGVVCLYAVTRLRVPSKG
jgi:hypothetical protein